MNGKITINDKTFEGEHFTVYYKKQVIVSFL